MFYVYLIKSISHPEQKYIGQTDDLKKRLKQHNAGYSIHTAKYKPWELVNYFAFISKDAALEFEQYLKTGSGHAFAKKTFLEIIYQGAVAHSREQKYKALASSKVKFRKIMSLTTVSNCL